MASMSKDLFSFWLNSNTCFLYDHYHTFTLSSRVYNFTRNGHCQWICQQVTDWLGSIRDLSQKGQLGNNLASTSSSSPLTTISVWPITSFPASLPACRMLINSTKATCLSSRPWRRSTPCPSPATSGEAQPTNATRQILTGLKAFKRKPCSHAGREHQTTAPSAPCSDLSTAPNAQSWGTPTMGQGLRPQSDFFFHWCSLPVLSDTEENIAVLLM